MLKNSLRAARFCLRKLHQGRYGHHARRRGHVEAGRIGPRRPHYRLQVPLEWLFCVPQGHSEKQNIQHPAGRRAGKEKEKKRRVRDAASTHRAAHGCERPPTRTKNGRRITIQEDQRDGEEAQGEAVRVICRHQTLQEASIRLSSPPKVQSRLANANGASNEEKARKFKVLHFPRSRKEPSLGNEVSAPTHQRVVF